MGGVQGYYTGANLSIGKPGQAFPVSRVPVTAVAGGLASEIQGGRFQDGFKLNGALAAITWTALKMRAATSNQSKLNPDNSSGVSAGVNDDGVKDGGGRFNVEKKPLYFANGDLNPDQIAPLGGFQGGPGSFFGRPYLAGGFLDGLVEHFAGPHDWLGSWWSYDINGNNNPTMSFFGKFLPSWGARIMDSVSTVVDIPLASPFAAAPVMGLAPYAGAAFTHSPRL